MPPGCRLLDPPPPRHRERGEAGVRVGYEPASLQLFAVGATDFTLEFFMKANATDNFHDVEWCE